MYIGLGLGLWGLAPLSTILQLYHGVHFIGGGNQSTQRKSLTCRNSLTKLYHIMLYQVHLTMCEIQTHNFSGNRH
jgi:uncharacterized protein (UPF0276 family)